MLKPPPPLKRIDANTDLLTVEQEEEEEEEAEEEDEEVRLPGEAVTAAPLEDAEEEDGGEMSLSEDEEVETAEGAAAAAVVGGGRAAQRIYCDDTTKFCQVRCKLCSKLMAYDGILGECILQCFGSGLDPGSIRSVNPDPDSESRSGSRRAKMTP